MAVKNLFSFSAKLCLVSISIHVFVIPFLVEGFSVELVHRDHPKVTDQEPPKTHYETLHRAFRRSLAMQESLKAQLNGSSSPSSSSSKPTMNVEGSKGDFESYITNAEGEYLMEVSIGTPPFTFRAPVLTADDITWTQCVPCDPCPKLSVPIFDPVKSSSYKKLTCDSPLCPENGITVCNASQYCLYQKAYSGGLASVGDLSTETFTFRTDSGQNVSIPNVGFGCQHAGTTKYQGFIGLGRGNLSLLTQFGNFTDGKFSYCLSPFFDKTSKISFGASAVVSGNDTKSTPLYRGTEENIYYFLKLEGLSVIQGTNSTRINYSTTTPLNTGKGNINIGTASAVTYLPSKMVTELQATLRQSISGTIEPNPAVPGSLCYKAGQGTQFPDIVAHFTGADILLLKFNTFLQINDNLICLAILGTDGLPIFGNLAQGDYHIGYDLVNNVVSFQKTDCSKIV